MKIVAGDADNGRVASPISALKASSPSKSPSKTNEVSKHFS